MMRADARRDPDRDCLHCEYAAPFRSEEEILIAFAFRFLSLSSVGSGGMGSLDLGGFATRMKLAFHFVRFLFSGEFEVYSIQMR